MYTYTYIGIVYIYTYIYICISKIYTYSSGIKGIERTNCRKPLVAAPRRDGVGQEVRERQCRAPT